jgi:hypothetical protein
MGFLVSNVKEIIEQQISSLRESDFDPCSAYGEVIDNSIQANAKNIKVDFGYVTKKRNEYLETIAFGDDGDGMGPKTIEDCLGFGFSTRYDDRDGIGRFGVGLTLAFLNQCLKCEVYSKQKGKDWYYTYSDIGSSNDKKNIIPAPVKKEPPKKYQSLIGNKSGTLVIWQEHDKQDFKTTELIEQFKIWSGRTYRKFVDYGIKIFINGTKIKTIDPLYIKLKNSKFPKDKKAEVIINESLEWPVDKDKAKKKDETGKINIKLSLFPIHLRKGWGDKYRKFSDLMKERNLDEENVGLSIVRNDREVFYGVPHPWVKNLAFNTEDRFIGFEVNFNAKFDKQFTVKNIKRGAVPVIELKRAISEKVKGVITNLRVKIKEQWKEYHAQQLINESESGITTGHEDAEKVLIKQVKTKDPLTIKSDKKELEKKITSQLLDERHKKQRAEWEAKFKSQPYTILDSEWAGSEFVELGYTKEGAVMKYNLTHPLHVEIAELINAMEAETDAEKMKAKAKRLKGIIDLVLISYCKAEKQVDPDDKVTNVFDFLEDLRKNWGNYLRRYIRDYK